MKAALAGCPSGRELRTIRGLSSGGPPFGVDLARSHGHGGREQSLGGVRYCLTAGNQDGHQFCAVSCPALLAGTLMHLPQPFPDPLRIGHVEGAPERW